MAREMTQWVRGINSDMRQLYELAPCIQLLVVWMSLMWKVFSCIKSSWNSATNLCLTNKLIIEPLAEENSKILSKYTLLRGFHLNFQPLSSSQNFCGQISELSSMCLLPISGISLSVSLSCISALNLNRTLFIIYEIRLDIKIHS